MTKLISIPKSFLLALCALVLFGVAGCAKKSLTLNGDEAPAVWKLPGKALAEQPAQPVGAGAERVQSAVVQPEKAQLRSAHSEGCRSCHAPNGAAGAKDFSSIYDDPKSHHPVGIEYPLVAQTELRFNRPNGLEAEGVFFDRNGNGKADSDEIRLFGTAGAVTIECASCHKEHGSAPPSGKAPERAYLRIANVASALCTTCHNQ